MKYSTIFVCCGDLLEFADYINSQEFTTNSEWHGKTAFRDCNTLFVYVNHSEKLKGVHNPGLVFYGNFMNHDYETIFFEYRLRSNYQGTIEDFLNDQRRSQTAWI